MRRRALLSLIGASLFPIVARAQQKPLPVIGFLNTLESVPEFLDAFRKGLEERGYREDRNVTVVYRSAAGDYGRLPGLAAELVKYPADVIVTTGGGLSGLAAKAATTTIPIVVFSGDDPVKLGFAASISRPGGNITGVAQLVAAANAKRLELLHELVPDADPIGYLRNPNSAYTERQAQEAAAATARLGIHLSVNNAGTTAELAAAYAAMADQHLRALYVGPDPFFYMVRDQLIALSSRFAVPTMYFYRAFVTAGGLISYGTRLTDSYYWLGVYTGKILGGAKPADLPFVQLSEKIELVVNLKTAKALGLAVPSSILARAAEVIE